MASSEPVEVPDQEHERIFDRVCAISHIRQLQALGFTVTLAATA